MSSETDTSTPAPAETRARILAATARLIAQGGIQAATTRAVAAEAAVQPPTIYRLFGDKDGLLEAVAEQSMRDYVAKEGQRPAMDDPVTELREAWDIYIAFSLSQPAVFRLVFTPQSRPSSAFAAGQQMLLDRVRRVARAGRLRVTEERAVELIHAVGTGTALTLLQKPPRERQGLADAARQTIFAAILIQPLAAPQPEPSAAGAAAALRAELRDLPCLTPGERQLMDELLERIGRGTQRGPGGQCPTAC